MTEQTDARRPGGLITQQHLDILFEEYRALYGLVELRLTSLDRRALLAWAALGAFLTGFNTMGEGAQQSFLLGVPLAVFWLLRTTVNHARSFEDAIRRIDQIECEVNSIAGAKLLAFQSRHPAAAAPSAGGQDARHCSPS